jgi:ABC-type spermidine/putrescine transport system permease subunit I
VGNIGNVTRIVHDFVLAGNLGANEFEVFDKVFFPVSVSHCGAGLSGGMLVFIGNVTVTCRMEKRRYRNHWRRL